MKHFVLSFIMMCSVQFTVVAAIPGKIIHKTITVAARVSGKSLSRAAMKTSSATLKKLSSQYGKHVLKTVECGGLEAMHIGSKYGHDFWKLTRNASPAAIRSLVLHSDELMPIAKRVGKNFMTLESKVPGLGAEVVTVFGDDAARLLAQKAPADDIAKLLGYASRADYPSTKRALFEAYKRGGSQFLSKLNWKHIMATGLSTATIVAAYKLSDGVSEGLITVAQNDPKNFINSLNTWQAPITWGLWFLVIIIVIPAGIWAYKFSMKIWRGKKQE